MGLLSLGADESKLRRSDSIAEGLRLEKRGGAKKNTYSINLDLLKTRMASTTQVGATTLPRTVTPPTATTEDKSTVEPLMTEAAVRNTVPASSTGSIRPEQYRKKEEQILPNPLTENHSKTLNGPPSLLNGGDLMTSVLEPDQVGFFLFKIDFTIDGVPAPLTVRGGDSPQSAAFDWVDRYKQLGNKDMILTNVLKAADEFLQVEFYNMECFSSFQLSSVLVSLVHK